VQLNVLPYLPHFGQGKKNSAMNNTADCPWCGKQSTVNPDELDHMISTFLFELQCCACQRVLITSNGVGLFISYVAGI
jgi:hypothetical protein